MSGAGIDRVGEGVIALRIHDTPDHRHPEGVAVGLGLYRQGLLHAVDARPERPLVGKRPGARLGEIPGHAVADPRRRMRGYGKCGVMIRAAIGMGPALRSHAVGGGRCIAREVNGRERTEGIQRIVSGVVWDTQGCGPGGGCNRKPEHARGKSKTAYRHRHTPLKLAMSVRVAQSSLC